MSQLWGCLSPGGESAADELLAQMTRGAGGAPHSTATCQGGALAASVQGQVAVEDGILAVISGRPRFASPSNGNTTGARQLIALWRQFGPDALKKIHGVFSVALLDTSHQTSLLAVDRLGIERICFAHMSGHLVFGSNCGSVLAHPSLRREINPQGIFNYLYSHMVPAPGSIYKGIEKLLPAQYALIKNGQVSREFYWEPSWEDGTHADFAQKSGELHGLLDQCVRDALDDRPAGAFLSGGTDSSTVSGMLTRVSGKPAETFSIGFEAEGFDEIEYARIAVRHFGMHAHEYYVTPDDVLKAIPLIASTYDEPFGNASAVPTYFCALKAREAGIDVMLAGDGGDEIFGGNSRYAKQKIFEAYGRLPGIMRAGLIEPALRLPGVDAIMPLRKAKSYVHQANVPLPDRLESYNYLHRQPLVEIFTPEFLSSIDPDAAAETQREVYFRTRAESPINRMLHLDWKQTLADNDLVKVGRMCEAAGVDVRYPLLDERMVEFAAMLPPSYKVRGQKLRWFFKEALKDFLPREILTKSKHGFGLPFGLWMKSNPDLSRLAEESLRAFRARGYVRESYMDQLMQAHRSEHATYYGVMIWVMMMLEQWLQHHDG